MPQDRFSRTDGSASRERKPVHPRLIVANGFQRNLKLLKRIGVAEINANVGKRTHEYMGM